MSNTITGDEILLLYQKDEVVFKKVYNSYFERLCLFAYAITKNRTESEDIAISALTKLWQFDKKFKSEKDLRNYIFAIAKNTSLTYCRNEKRKNSNLRKLRYLIDDTEYDLFHGHDVNNIVQILDELIAGASGEYAKVVRLHFQEKKNRKEIAMLLNMKVNSVSGHLNYGINKIVQLFRRIYDA